MGHGHAQIAVEQLQPGCKFGVPEITIETAFVPLRPEAQSSTRDIAQDLSALRQRCT